MCPNQLLQLTCDAGRWLALSCRAVRSRPRQATGAERRRRPDMPRHDFSMQAARAFDDVTARLDRLSLDEAVHEYDAVVERFRPHVDKTDLRELCRRAAENALVAAVEKAADHAICRDLFHRIVNLGFTDFERETTMTIIYARHIAGMGHQIEAIGLASALVTSLRSVDSRYAAPFLSEAQKVQEELARGSA